MAEALAERTTCPIGYTAFASKSNRDWRPTGSFWKCSIGALVLKSVWWKIQSVKCVALLMSHALRKHAYTVVLLILVSLGDAALWYVKSWMLDSSRIHAVQGLHSDALMF